MLFLSDFLMNNVNMYLKMKIQTMPLDLFKKNNNEYPSRRKRYTKNGKLKISFALCRINKKNLFDYESCFENVDISIIVNYKRKLEKPEI